MTDSTPTDGYDFGIGYGADGKGINDSAIQAKPGLEPYPHSELPEGSGRGTVNVKPYNTNKPDPNKPSIPKPDTDETTDVSMGDLQMEVVEDMGDQKNIWATLLKGASSMDDKKAGDISHVFENPLPDLDWLKVDEDAYRQHEKLPKQNLDAVPDLVQAWTTHDKGINRFIPNLDPEMAATEGWVGQKVVEKKAATLNEIQPVVARALKERMMAGWTGHRLAAWVRDHVEGEYIPALAPMLRKIAEEQGILGTVYVDATHWPECDRGEGKEIVARARHSKYVLGNEEKCGGCIHNEDGRCAVFKRELVFDVVPYDKNLVDEYAQKFKAPMASVIASDSPKEQLRAIVSHYSLAKHDPNSSELRKAEVEGAQVERDRTASGLYEPPSANFMNPTEAALYRDLSRKMMANGGLLSSHLQSRLAHSESEAVQTLSAERHLLGKVYVRPDQFDNCHSANDFFRRHNAGASYIVKMAKCSECQFHRSTGRCSLMDREVVEEVPFTANMLATVVAGLVDAGQMDRETADGLISRAASEPARDLIAEAYGTKTPVAAEYENEYDHVAHMSTEAPVAMEFDDGTSPIPLAQRPVVMAAYKAAYRGAHGEVLKNELVGQFGREKVVEAAEYLKPIARMAGLLGNVILDMRGFKSASQAQEFLRKRGMAPRYLLKEGCGVGCRGQMPDYRKNFPNLTLLNYGEIGDLELEYTKAAVTKLERDGRIAAGLAEILRSQVGDVPADQILRAAFTSPMPKEAVTELPDPVTEYRVTNAMAVEVDDVREKRADLDFGLGSAMGDLPE